MKLPKKLYVYQEKEKDGSIYLIASKSLPDTENEVGIYELVETGHVIVSVEWLPE